MLTCREVVPYLLRRQLISPDCMTVGDLTIEETSRRHHHFKITPRVGRCFLIKQGAGKERVAAIAREARVYRFLQSNADTAGLQGYVPRCYEYDPREELLVLELLRDTIDVRERHARTGRFSTSLAADIGRALATLHGYGINESSDVEDRFAPQPPWVLSVHRPDLRMFCDLSSANVQIVKIVQQFDPLCRALDELREGWRDDTFIHFDLRWDNLIVPTRSPGGPPRVKIVDWELAGEGDRFWDVGTIFAEYLSFWLSSIPISGETPPDRFMELARCPVQTMQPAMRAFWLSYVRATGLTPAMSREGLLRAVRYGAARLIQTSIERTHFSAQLAGAAVCLLQLSSNMLGQPQEAALHLLGIPPWPVM